MMANCDEHQMLNCTHLIHDVRRMQGYLDSKDAALSDCLRVLKMTERWLVDEGHSRFCKAAVDSHDVPAIVAVHCDCGTTERVLDVRAVIKRHFE